MIVEAEMILIKNARVMDPESGFDQVTDILLDGKRIRQMMSLALNRSLMLPG